MALPAAPAGWTRHLVTSKFGAGRDFVVRDPQTDEQRFLVDGKIGTRPKADILDASGNVLYRVTGKLFGIPKQMTITTADGVEVASLRAKAFSVLRSRMTLEVAGGEPWTLEGSFSEKNYSISSGGRSVVEITQKWVTIRDTYTIDVADGIDVGLGLAILWAVDRRVERD